jgi:AraC family transcriptional regulator
MALLITPRELPEWVPGTVLCASDELGWNGVATRSYRYDGLDVEVPALSDFVIIAYRQGTTQIQRRFEGAWTRTRCAPGDLSLLTRSQWSHWHWTDRIEVSHVYLTDRFVSAIANEVTNRTAAEVRLHDILRIQDPILSSAVDAVTREASLPRPGTALYVEAVATQLVVHLIRNYASITFEDSQDRSALTPGQRKRLADYVDAHLHEPLGLEQLAGSVGLGLWSFTRRFRESFGCTAHQYLMERRTERARQLLLRSAMPVKEIASACGFSDQAHMTRVFKDRLSATPASLRRNA